MSKKDSEKQAIELEKLFSNTKVQPVEVEGELKKSFLAYAMAVNVSRAIPDVRDGLKPVHRRIIYTMGELGVFNDKPFKKSIRIVGEVLGKYHPHGDSAVYDSMVRLAQDFTINHPLVQGHGNFGSVDGDSAAASRYTEARLSKIAAKMLEDIDKDTVDMYPNFDDTLMQPTVLPSLFPNLLVNGADGIAVGMATNIPPHNLNEVIDGVIALIDNPEIDIEDLIKIIPAPDYPTGGIIMGGAAIRHAYRTGRGGIVVRGKANIEEREGGKERIIITEIPYQVNKSRLIIQMADLVKSKRLEGITDIKEESDRDGMRIVVDVKKEANAQVVLNNLYKLTQLQTSNGIIFLALVKNEPKILNLKEMIYYYLEHQKEVTTRRTRFDLGKAEEREHIVQGLVIALARIDEVIATIKHSADKAEALNSLVAKFELSEKQAIAILEMKLQKLTGLEVAKLENELAELDKLVADLKDILSNENRILDMIKNQLLEIKTEFGVPRKTEISIDYGDIDIADLIAREQVVVCLTHGGYIKRMSSSEYRAQRRGGVGVSAQKIKEEDFVENMFITCTHNDLLFFTNKGKVYSIKTYEIPEAQRQSKGRAIINLLPLASDEKVNAIIPKAEGVHEGMLIMATKNGLIKKTDLVNFERINKNGKIAISLKDEDELVSVELTSGDSDVLMACSSGKCIRFNEKALRPTGRESQGVRSMRMAKDDKVVDMTVIKKGSQIITVSEQGYGKRSSEEEYRVQGRAGMGIKAGVFNEQTGKLVSMKQVCESDDIVVIADNGIIIRTPASAISMISRNTKGVRIMKLAENAKVVSVSTTQPEEKEEEILAEAEAENEKNEMEQPSLNFEESSLDLNNDEE
ncbi:MAG: DNA gyrase subunit A [Clostridia bacterium]